MIKFSLNRNKLNTADKSPFVPRTVPVNCITLESLINSIVFNSTITPQDAKAMIEALFNEMLEQILNGMSVNMGFAIVKAVVKGSFANPDEQFNPVKHSIQATITPTANLNKRLSEKAQAIQIISRKEIPSPLKLFNHSSEDQKFYKSGDLVSLTGQSMKYEKNNANLGVFISNDTKTIRVQEISLLRAKRIDFKFPFGLEIGKQFSVSVKGIFGSEIREGKLEQEVWTA